MALGDLTAAFQPLGEELEKMEPGYHSSAWQEGERQRTQKKQGIQKALSQRGQSGSGARPQRGCATSSLGGFQDSTGSSLKQPGQTPQLTVRALKALMALSILTCGLHPHPWAQDPI